MLKLCLIFLADGFMLLAKDMLETTIQYPLLVTTVALLTVANIKAKHIFG